MSDDGEREAKTGDVDVNELVPCFGLCCCIFSCYTQLPDCLGSVCENTLLCCLCKVMTCKTSKEPGAFCKCFNADCDCIHFKTCCQAKAQSFCIDSRIAFPPTDEIPCLLTCCCITCCYKNGCLCTVAKNIGEIDEKSGSKGRVSPKKNKKYDNGEEGNWVQVTDPSTGKVYWMEKDTGKTQWENPYE